MLVTALVGPRVAAAQTEPPSWLLKYISYYVNEGSNPPNIGERTVLRFYGWYPYDCGGIRDQAVIDQGHLNLKLRKASEICGDTTRTWNAEFNLGFLPLGDHELTVTRTFVNEAGTDSIRESASFTFPVVDLGSPGPPPPPPGPPPLPNALVPGVTGWFTVPAQPTALEATTLILKGVFPYDCGEIVDASSDSGSVSFTMQPGPACSDTARTWTQAFALGQLHAGPHVIHVTRRLISPDSNAVAEGDVGFYVWVDYNTPPSGPPPAPEFPSVLIRCLSGWQTTAPPTTHDPTTLMLWGWFPYHCGQIIDAGVPAPNQVSLTLRNNPNGCSDTTLTWFQSFTIWVCYQEGHKASASRSGSSEIPIPMSPRPDKRPSLWTWTTARCRAVSRIRSWLKPASWSAPDRATTWTSGSMTCTVGA